MKKLFLTLLFAFLITFSFGCKTNYYNPDSKVNATTQLSGKYIILTENKIGIQLGETYKIDAKMSDNYNDKIVFKSADDKIAAVDQNGIVYSKSIGVVNIIASTEDGKTSDTIAVTVSDFKRMNITGSVPLTAAAGDSFTVKIDFENCIYPSVKIIADCGGGKISANGQTINLNSQSRQYQVLGKTTLTFKISDTKEIDSIRIIGFDNGQMIDSKEYNISIAKPAI